MKTKLYLLSTVLLVLLSACGGGGSSDSIYDPNTPVPPAPEDNIIHRVVVYGVVEEYPGRKESLRGADLWQDSLVVDTWNPPGTLGWAVFRNVEEGRYFITAIDYFGNWYGFFYDLENLDPIPGYDQTVEIGLPLHPSTRLFPGWDPADLDW